MAKYVDDMAVDFAGDVGEMALNLVQLRTIQGAARDETKEIKKREREKNLITYYYF